MDLEKVRQKKVLSSMMCEHTGAGDLTVDYKDLVGSVLPPSHLENLRYVVIPRNHLNAEGNW